jgi:hypothetical protein
MLGIERYAGYLRVAGRSSSIAYQLEKGKRLD